ncbi:lytic polysaccharide monooxygenase [Lentithecium fluviatile CBS 122367]|uniref:lytic cellulose monooxygenase (C4-dehydrogenating) n=1 Tax=Lentithecium fluviatile CBS 122367 TaxID=1168545 RepID=A0A6G1ISZ1_9PLEO|nr:lytic polysaccharide monooxygenase [Lentithecium fluviatile CBS 122367]
MKFSAAFGAALAASSVNAAALQPRHYTFPAITGTSDWSSVRQTVNYQSNAGLSDVSSDQIRCYTSGTKSASSTTSVAAGGSVSFKASPNIFHQGPLQFYMAKVPAGKTAKDWDGSGQVWFKIYAEKASVSGGQLSWASLNQGTVSVTIPRNTPSGDYLLRIEHIALHQASQVNGAQFYISCAQITVTGGGSGSPGPLVSFPGAYKNTDPGIKVNIYSGATSYTPPGPAVWSG